MWLDWTNFSLGSPVKVASPAACLLRHSVNAISFQTNLCVFTTQSLQWMGLALQITFLSQDLDLSFSFTVPIFFFFFNSYSCFVCACPVYTPFLVKLLAFYTLYFLDSSPPPLPSLLFPPSPSFLFPSLPIFLFISLWKSG